MLQGLFLLNKKIIEKSFVKTGGDGSVVSVTGTLNRPSARKALGCCSAAARSPLRAGSAPPPPPRGRH